MINEFNFNYRFDSKRGPAAGNRFGSGLFLEKEPEQ
jgi:hypothetical protein